MSNNQPKNEDNNQINEAELENSGQNDRVIDASFARQYEIVADANGEQVFIDTLTGNPTAEQIEEMIKEVEGR